MTVMLLEKPELSFVAIYYGSIPISTGLHIIVMRCAIWYHLHNLKDVKSTHGGVLILVKLQAEASPMGVFHVFKIVQMAPNHATPHS